MSTSSASVGTSPSLPLRKRKRKRLREDDGGGDTNGFELSEEDIEALRTIKQGQTPDDKEALAWLQECDLIDEQGQLTELGQSLA